MIVYLVNQKIDLQQVNYYYIHLFNLIPVLILKHLSSYKKQKKNCKKKKLSFYIYIFILVFTHTQKDLPHTHTQLLFTITIYYYKKKKTVFFLPFLYIYTSIFFFFIKRRVSFYHFLLLVAVHQPILILILVSLQFQKFLFVQRPQLLFLKKNALINKSTPLPLFFLQLSRYSSSISSSRSFLLFIKTNLISLLKSSSMTSPFSTR